MNLRNGSTSKDPRLTRLVQFDDKSRNYKATAVIPAGAQPKNKTWSCSEVLDQGPDGACTGFAWAHELIATPCSIKKGIDAKYAKEKLYWEAQKIDEWEGGSYPGASPQYEGSSVLASAKAAKATGHITEYRWAFGLDDLILSVGHLGPVVLGINWYEGMFDPHPCGYIHVTGELSGGHAILCRGVNVKEEYALLHNSWGRFWGKAGTAKISFKELDTLLKEDGEACIPTGRQ